MDSRRGSNACSQSSLSSSASSITAARDLWRLRQTMHCLEQCDFYHGNLNRNEARERMRRCRPGCFIIRDSNDPQFLFTLQQTLHFVGPCATRIAFVNGLFRFDQDANQVLNSNGERVPPKNLGFPCVLRLIEHYSQKYEDMGVIALRYPVIRGDLKIQDGIGPPHKCCVEPSAEDLTSTPRMIHPEVAASLAGSSGAPSCMSCTSHSGPDERIFNERGQHGQRVNRSASDGFISASLSQSNSQFQLNNDPNCRLSVQSLQPVSHNGRGSSRNSVDHGSGTLLAIHPNELKSSLQELQTKIQAQKSSIPETLLNICPEVEPLISTERRSSVDRNGTSPYDHHAINSNGRSSHIEATSSGGGLRMTNDLARDLYSLKMNNGLPLGLEHHVSQTNSHHTPGNDSVDYSLNSNFANVQIDLDNLAQVLGSTSIQVGSKSNNKTNSSNTTLPDDRDCEIAIPAAAKNNCSGHTHCSASPTTLSPTLPGHLASHETPSLPVFNVVTPPPKVPSMTSSVHSSPIGLQNRNSLTIGSDDYY